MKDGQPSFEIAFEGLINSYEKDEVHEVLKDHYLFKQPRIKIPNTTYLKQIIELKEKTTPPIHSAGEEFIDKHFTEGDMITQKQCNEQCMATLEFVNEKNVMLFERLHELYKFEEEVYKLRMENSKLPPPSQQDRSVSQPGDEDGEVCYTDREIKFIKERDEAKRELLEYKISIPKPFIVVDITGAPMRMLSYKDNIVTMDVEADGKCNCEFGGEYCRDNPDCNKYIPQPSQPGGGNHSAVEVSILDLVEEKRKLQAEIMELKSRPSEGWSEPSEEEMKSAWFDWRKNFEEDPDSASSWDACLYWYKKRIKKS